MYMGLADFDQPQCGFVLIWPQHAAQFKKKKREVSVMLNSR